MNIFYFISFLFVLNLAKCELVEKFVDFEEDFDAVGLSYEHSESVKYFDYDEELINVKTEAMEAERVGIWVYESIINGPCCGGLLDIRAPLPAGIRRNVTMVMSYVTNVDLHVWWATANGEVKKTKIVPTPIQNEIHWPNGAKSESGKMINWVQSVIYMDMAHVFFNINANFGIDGHGFLLIDKIFYSYEEDV